jgi:outer membrane protein OmpA-like peptidoglycan-associated protein
LAQPFVLDVAPISVDIDKLSFESGAASSIDAALKLPDEGSVEVAGSLALSPLAADLRVRADGVALERFQPYVARFAQVEVEGGSARVDGQLTVATADDGVAVIEYKGAASVRELSVLDTARSEDLVKWTALELQDIAYVSRPPAFHIGAAVAEQPYARIIVSKDGRLNLAELGVQVTPRPESASPAPAPAEAAAEAGAGDEMPIVIDSLQISNGHTDFADYSIEPNVDTGIVDLDGEILGLSSDPKAKSKISLAGSVGKHAPAKIVGIINPFNPFTQTDLNVSFDNVSLTIFTPYSARFLGYRIRKGKASVDLKYQVEDGRLRAHNEVVLDQLTLGERVESPEATNLPVAFAVALLKDRSGRINLNLPVRGNLDDPKFSYSRILMNTFFDLIKKTVASPFSVLGALADFDSEELKYVEFDPGQAVLDEEQTKKIDAISEALKERPALRLEVSGGVDRLADAAALAELELTKALKRAKKAELKADGQPVPKKLSAIELSNEDSERLFDEKYEEQFGTDAPRNEQGEITAAARQALAGSFQIDDAALRGLAKKRATAIQDRIVENGVDTSRVFLVEADLLRTKEEGEVRSELSLTS